MPISLVEFGLELHPVQSQRMQEALHDVHSTKNAEGDHEPKHKHDGDHDDVPPYTALIYKQVLPDKHSTLFLFFFLIVSMGKRNTWR